MYTYFTELARQCLFGFCGSPEATFNFAMNKCHFTKLQLG